MQSIAPVNQVVPEAMYRPPAQRVDQGPRAGGPLVPSFRMGVADTAVLPFLAGLVLGAAL